jgi:DNA invertase Pin-like site-specific DNA recombinase
MVTIIEAVAQAENESRSENIKMGFRMAAESGKSKLYNRKCYGYINDSDEKLLVNEDEAENVKLIFEWYLKGKSILGIQKELEKKKDKFTDR